MTDGQTEANEMQYSQRGMIPETGISPDPAEVAEEGPPECVEEAPPTEDPPAAHACPVCEQDVTGQFRLDGLFARNRPCGCYIWEPGWHHMMPAAADPGEGPPASETDDNLVHYPSGATRTADAEDVRYDLIPPSAHDRVARRYALGARAHGDRNWEKGQPAGATVNHLERHLNLWKSGDRSDDHLAAAAWGLYCLMHHEEFHPDLIEADFPAKEPRTETIEDGFGSAWDKMCPGCGCLSMEVVRPGKVQCSNCG